MGGNQVYGPQLPEMPAEYGRQRKSAWDYMYGGATNPAAAPFDLTYTPNPYQSAAGDAYKNFLGTLGSPGGPQPGQGLESQMPMWSGAGDLSSLIKEGMATGFLGDTSSLFNAKKDLYSQTMKDMWGNAVGSNFLAGGGVGGRGTGIANVIGDISNRGSIGLAAEMAPFDFQNINAAADRRLGAGQMGMSFTDMLNQEAARRIGATAGYGQQEWTNWKAMQDMQYQDWLRKQPGYNPAGNNIFQWGMQYPFSAQAPTVVPPWWQSLLGGALQAGGAVAAAAV